MNVHKLIKAIEKLSYTAILQMIWVAYKEGYERGHDDTVESEGYQQEEAADEYLDDLKEELEKEQ